MFHQVWIMEEFFFLVKSCLQYLKFYWDCKSNKSIACTKGQIMSECIYEIIDFPKYNRKNLINFCPGRFYRLGTYNLFWLFSRRLYFGECITYLVWINFQGRNLSNFFGGILENWFWLHLTFTNLELSNVDCVNSIARYYFFLDYFSLFTQFCLQALPLKSLNMPRKIFFQLVT